MSVLCKDSVRTAQ